MPARYRVGIVGVAHMHINYLAAEFARHPLVDPVCCADTVPDRPEIREAPHTRAWNLKYCADQGFDKVYADYRQMLAAEKLDIVLSCAENAKHAEVSEACAAAGAHVLFEKPMASSLSHALRMVRAVKAAGTKLVINWPTTWDPAIRLAKDLLDAGQIGRILQVKWRAGHMGPLGPGVTHPGVSAEAGALNTVELAATWWHHSSTGGGALLDYCCYGCMLSRWYIGQSATSAVAMSANLNSQWSDAEDNAVLIARYPESIGVFEGSWTQLDPGIPGGPIVYGQTGTLIVEPREGQRIVRIERGKGESEIHAPLPLSPARDDVAKELIQHLQTGEPLHPTIDLPMNVEIMALLDAGARAARSGKVEQVNSPVWCIG